MTPFEWFLYHEVSLHPHYGIDLDEPEYEIGYSDYVIVDGEEADHGTKHYYCDGTLLATYYNAGGDSGWYEYTYDGIRFFKEKAREVFEDILSTIKNEV